MTEFENENSVYLIGSSRYHSRIQDSLTGYNRINGIEENGIMHGTFSEVYTINSDINSDEYKVCELWFSYLLSEVGQNQLLVQNRKSLPLNAKSFELALSLKPSLGFLRNTENIVLSDLNDSY
mgnify:FL=1